MLHLYLARHGQTIENTKHLLQGHLPGCLTPEGKQQMHLLGQLLTAAGWKFDALLCSDLQRAQDSAALLGQKSAFIPLAMLRERNWGPLTGLPVNSLTPNAPLPSGVESTEAMQQRAAQVVSYLLTTYRSGQHVLCLGHGLFNRFIAAAICGTTYRQIPRFINASCRHYIVKELGNGQMKEEIAAFATHNSPTLQQS